LVVPCWSNSSPDMMRKRLKSCGAKGLSKVMAWPKSRWLHEGSGEPRSAGGTA
jgi:hypothetical protein